MGDDNQYQCKCCWFSAVQVQQSAVLPKSHGSCHDYESCVVKHQCMHINRCGLGAKLQMKTAKHLLHEYKFSTVSYHTMIHISRFHIFWHTWTSQGQGKHVKPKYIYIHILPHDITLHMHMLTCPCVANVYTHYILLWTHFTTRLLVAFSKNSTYQR